jgi:hypothetical protein
VPPIVRVIYIVPVGTKPWDEAECKAAEVLEDLQWFFADEMERWGYGPKSFEIATDENDSLVFHQIDSRLTRDEFMEEYWNNCKNAARDRGLRDPTDITDVTVYFYEAYSFFDGIVSHAGAKGWPRGKGGEAFLSSLHLKIARREWISNENGYDGEVFHWIDSEPMKRGTLSWHGRGTKLGDVSGSGFGAIAHELSHCFAVPNQEKMKAGRKGPLMGNGFLGMRGYFRPDLTDDRCFLREQDAAVLDKNNFFAVRKLKPKSISFTGK